MRNNQRSRLSHTILGFLSAAFGISLFLFTSLQSFSRSLFELYVYRNHINLSEDLRMQTYFWINTTGFIISVIFFVILFLIMLAQKISYLKTIIGGVHALRLKGLDYEVLVEGNDELAELAESINYLSRTERMLAEKERHLKEDREILIRSLSHDIRTPLTSMMSYTEYYLQKEDIGKEEIRKYLEIMLSKERKMKELTDLLLDETKISKERFEDGLFLIEQLVEEWEEDLEERFHCDIRIQRDKAFVGEFDIRDLRRLFGNLASNINKYANDKEKIVLDIFIEDTFLCIEQTNTKLQEIKDVDSHGLGLKNIESIANSYGGDMSISENEESFHIRIRLKVE